MSQFNSIFSPLTNKLARLEGITLLAVANLFASTQQMSAQTCIQNLSINLGRSCEINISPEMVALGLPAGTYYVRINDNSPTDSKVNAVSPASGWTYGLFKQAGGSPSTSDALICQGTIITTDDAAPVFSAAQAAAWADIDTVITWADNLNEIQDQAQFGSANNAYGTAPRSLTTDFDAADGSEIAAFAKIQVAYRSSMDDRFLRIYCRSKFDVNG